MKELISDEDRTVVIVSHSSNTLKDLCGGWGVGKGWIGKLGLADANYYT